MSHHILFTLFKIPVWNSQIFVREFSVNNWSLNRINILKQTKVVQECFNSSSGRADLCKPNLCWQKALQLRKIVTNLDLNCVWKWNGFQREWSLYSMWTHVLTVWYRLQKNLSLFKHNKKILWQYKIQVVKLSNLPLWTIKSQEEWVVRHANWSYQIIKSLAIIFLLIAIQSKL